MRFLRSNTAVIVTVGPFYDKTDGVTIETALTITNERITLTADTDAGSAPTNILDNVTGATSATANDLNYITGNDAGMMQLELAAADVNRVGRMLLSITDAANHVPVFHEFFVLPQAIYDWLTGVIVPLPANVTQLLGTAWLTPGTAGTPDVNAKLVGGLAVPSGAIPNAVAGAAGGVFIAGTNAATAITTALTANIIGNITGALSGSVGSVVAGVTLAASAVQAIWDALTSALTTVGSIGKLLVDRIDAAITSRMATYTQPTGFLAATFPSDPADQSLIIAATDAIIAAVAALNNLSEANVRAAVGLATANLDTQLGDLPTNSELTAALAAADDAVLAAVAAVNVLDTAIKGKTDALPASPAATGDPMTLALDALNASALAADAVAEIAAAIAAGADPWDVDLPGAYAAGKAGRILGVNLDAAVSTRAVEAGGNVANLQTRVPAALTAGGFMKADMVALDGSTTSAARLRRSASLIHDGAVTGAATATTLIDSGLTHPDDDQLKGRILIFDGNMTAGLREQATDIVAFDAATDMLTFTAMTQAPVLGDTFVIV